MKQKIIEYFSKFKPLTAEEKDAITDGLDIRKFVKGSVLLKEGQVVVQTYFVLQGCIRKYYLIDGEERIADFFTEEQWILSNNFETNNVSDHYLECTEDSFLVVANEKEGEELMRRFPKFQELSQIVLEKEIQKQHTAMARFIKNSPEERYLNILNQRPDLIERVPQYQLASYIGIKPESLSRIRKRIAKKDK